MDVLDLVQDERRISADPAFVPFAGWTASECATLRRHGAIELLPPGAVAITRGASDRSLLLTLEGELEVVRHGRTVQRVGPGDLVGELAFIDGRPRTADVHARTLTKVFRLRPEDIDRLAEQQPVLATKFVREVARILAARLRGEWE